MALRNESDDIRSFRPNASGPGSRSALIRASVLLLSLGPTMQSQAQEPAADRTEVLKATARLIETKEESERTFKTDLVAKGMVAVLVRLSNPSQDATATIRRSDVLLRTEFDEQLTALEAQRAYDKLMMKVGGGPAFAEYGIGRAITEGSKKKTLRETILQRALPETVVLAPGQNVEATLFFDRGKNAGSFAYSTLIIGDVLTQADGRSVSFSMPLRPEE